MLGVDPSLTATALCAITQPDNRVRFTVSNTKAGKAGAIAKHDRMRIQVDLTVERAAASDLVVLEGPSFSSQGSATRDLAGLWWLMFQALRSTGTPLGVVPPAVLKKWISGTGVASKFVVGQHVAKRWPNVALRSNDEADALVLASIGLHVLDVLPWRPNAIQVEQLSRIEWIKWPGDRRAGTEDRRVS